MLNIHIPSDLKYNIKKKFLFILIHPFYSDNGWVLDNEQLDKWGLDNKSVNLVLDRNEADIILLPYSINHYIAHNMFNYLKKYNKYCNTNNIKAYAFISNDYGQAFPEFDNIIYFRMGGFRSQLSGNNIGLPAALSDHHLRLFGSENIRLRGKNKKPKIGFCGYSNPSMVKLIKESFMYIYENSKRFVENPTRKDYEKIFPSGYERSKILNNLERHNLVDTNFIHRKKYRAGATSENERINTTLEYYNNIRESDYILCLRGKGNFSIRFYETLLMGRIPIFINTDCLLPLQNHINWMEHVVWIEWKERHQIGEIVAKFHDNLSREDFSQLQLNNRKLWLKTLKPSYILTHCLN